MPAQKKTKKQPLGRHEMKVVADHAGLKVLVDESGHVKIELDDGQQFNLHCKDNVWLGGKKIKALAIVAHSTLVALPCAANWVDVVDDKR